MRETFTVPGAHQFDPPPGLLRRVAHQGRWPPWPHDVSSRHRHPCSRGTDVHRVWTRPWCGWVGGGSTSTTWSPSMTDTGLPPSDRCAG